LTSAGAPPQTPPAHSAPPDHLAEFKGPTSKGRRSEGEKSGGKGRRGWAREGHNSLASS